MEHNCMNNDVEETGNIRRVYCVHGVQMYDIRWPYCMKHKWSATAGKIPTGLEELWPNIPTEFSTLPVSLFSFSKFNTYTVF